jgi:hypothetical protein
MSKYLFLSLLVLFQSNLFQTTKIYDTEAAHYIGQTLTGIGTVNSFEISKNGSGMMLYCGTNYPTHYFTVIITSKPGDITKHVPLIGWNISVTGKIVRYKGMPAIKVGYLNDVQSVLLVDKVPSDI